MFFSYSRFNVTTVRCHNLAQLGHDIIVTSIRQLCFWVHSFVCLSDSSRSNDWVFLKFYVGRTQPEEDVIKFWMNHIRDTQKKS